jgi:RHS repeat-associated protein
METESHKIDIKSGNVRVVVSDLKKKNNPANSNPPYRAEVLAAYNYYPFGMLQPEMYKENNDKRYRFGFNGMLRDDDVTDKLSTGPDEVRGNSYDFGARMYNPRVTRFFSLDPETALMPAWSPYTFVFNNPLSFIDPDGRIPYPITIRAFAPFAYFGYGFHGDNRSYTTSSNASARLHQKINFDTDKTSMTTNAWSSPTKHILVPGSITGTPSVKFTGGLTIKQSGDYKTYGFGTHVAGANPMIPWSPKIDVFSNFSITENKKLNTLDISGTLKGDNFPSTEAFITDPSGNNVFIGIGFYEGSPFSSLDGENKREISNFNFSISTDKEGNFTGVKMGDKSYSLSDWNNMFQQADPHKNEEK